MKRVSFKIAKAIKEAGYKLKECDYILCAFDESETECVIDDITYLKPYAMEVWLWLWKKKNCYIQTLLFKDYVFKAYIFRKCACENKVFTSDDPEEAIIAAFDYLVDYDLIK